jgi:hypothetical protein
MDTPVAQMTRTAILSALRQGGFAVPTAPHDRVLAASIQLAARAGCLSWTVDRVVSTLADHLLDLHRVRSPRR